MCVVGAQCSMLMLCWCSISSCGHFILFSVWLRFYRKRANACMIGVKEAIDHLNTIDANGMTHEWHQTHQALRKNILEIENWNVHVFTLDVLIVGGARIDILPTQSSALSISRWFSFFDTQQNELRRTESRRCTIYSISRSVCLSASSSNMQAMQKFRNTKLFM